MAFHSTHATSHALQPMHVVVSTSLQTVSSRCVPAPGIVPGCPEILCMRSVAWLMSAPLCLFHFHQKTLELRRVRVRIHDRRRKQVHQRLRRLSFILGDAPVAPVNGNPYLIGLFAV